ncbi:MAG TPA: NCS2 family permease [Vicinamibacteria bacterium]|nr:NCS2 family permease [Vicinamibacteria bacterium]
MTVTAWLDTTFDLGARGSSVRTEVLAGVTTYMAMSYIILVNPAVLSTTGMDFGAVLGATCFASALATLWMGLSANYPIALAPGMGQNFFFALTICGPVALGGYGYGFREALAAVVVAGGLFVLASIWKLRARIIASVPDHLKRSMGVGIGFLVAIVGLRWGGIVTSVPGTYIGLGNLEAPAAVLTLFGLAVTSILLVLGVSAALLIGILSSTLVAVLLGLTRFEGVFGLPESVGSYFLVADFEGLFRQREVLAVIFVVLLVDLFDTVGTLIGVTERAGLTVEGQLPKAREAFLADAAGSVAGGLLGTSTVTSYVESAAGVSAGGRTGLSSVVTSVLLAGSVFFYPLLRVVGGGLQDEAGATLYPTLAPALILVGVFMMAGVERIDWSKPRVAIPAFLTVIMMPLTTSITEGIAFGFISTSVLYLAGGRARDLHWATHVIAAFFLARYVWL